jgi:hypothetical protein
VLKRIQRLILSGALAALALALVPATASAAIYYPSGAAAPDAGPANANDNDLNDLDHQYYYLWIISGLTKIADSQTVDSASITFHNLYNWNDKANILHLDLLDTGKTGSYDGSGTANDRTQLSSDPGAGYTSTVVRGFDSASDPQNPTKAELQDDAFDLDGTNLSALATTSTERTDLDDRAFVRAGGAPGKNASDNSTSNNDALYDLYYSFTHLSGTDFTSGEVGTNTTGADSQLFSLASWTVGNCYANQGCDYTYNFDANERALLKDYINNSNTGVNGTVALGFDPDCHFYNDGISFQFSLSSGSQANPAVPEPASLVLLGTGMLAAVRFRNRRRQS